MDYNQITNFLDKFKKIFFQNEAEKEVIASIITKHISFEITTNLISIKGTCIYIKSSPITRNEIFIHKTEILKNLLDLLPAHHFTDIK